MNQKEIEISISDIFRALKRRKKLFWAVFFLVIIISVGSLFVLKPKYEAYSVLEYSSEKNTQTVLSNLGIQDILDVSSGSEDLDTEMEKIKLDNILLKVVKDLNMVENANNNRNIYLKLTGKILTERDMVEYLRKNIKIELYKSNDLAKMPNLIKLSFQSTDPTFAASVIDLTYNYYLDFSKKNFISSKEKYIKNLNMLLKESKDNMEKMSLKLIDFKTTNLIDENSFYNKYFDYYYTLDLKLLDVKNQENSLKEKLKILEDNYINLNEKLKKEIALKTPEISNLKKQLISDKINYETLKLSSPNNPSLYELESKIKVEEKTLNDMIKNLIADNKKFLININFDKYIEYMSLKEKLENIDINTNVLIEMKNKVGNIISQKGNLLHDYIEIKNKLDYWTQKYEKLNSFLEQEKIKALIFEPKLKIVNPIFIPQRPIFPSKKNVVLLGTIFGIFFGILTSLMKDFKDPTIKDLSLFIRIAKTPDYIINKNNELRIIQKISSEIFSNKYKNVGFSCVGNYNIEILNSIYNELFNFKIDIEINTLKNSSDINLINKENKKISLFKLPNTEDGYFELYSQKMDILFLIVKEQSSEFEEFLRVYNNQKNIKIIYIM
ncbi:GumC family protein [Marinitoga sp. 1155]|uniref:GumC family protein n=1 Tax=Marinitoga sp. 1155 TaxID=1428448 RepID=UPI000640E55F|nr:Wzz/FepE/Etk N-terminal domain-containing protein [Marinitoga sp. 1155]KLO21180.1 hypothetical protein X274_10890 [Marinitoga sp. 1155]